MKISIWRNVKNEYDYKWFKENIDNKNIDVKHILMYSKNHWVDTKEYEIIYEDDKYYFIGDGKRTFLVKKEYNFKKGEKVQVTNTDYTYLRYDEWFKKYNIDATYWCYNTEPKENTTYTIVEIRKHLEEKDWIICLIEDSEGRMFLVKDKGLKRV